jgi:hypothetical protein
MSNHVVRLAEDNALEESAAYFFNHFSTLKMEAARWYLHTTLNTVPSKKTIIRIFTVTPLNQ